MMEEQQRRMMEEQQRRMMEERRPMIRMSACLCLLMIRALGLGTPMPPYDPRTGGVGKPIYDLLPVMPPLLISGMTLGLQ
jgi:hypothetical protein